MTKAAFLWQLLRFGLVGGSNTCLDFLILNILLWRFPTHDARLLLAYNSTAYMVAALNSFLLNKYWTFQAKQVAARSEVLRFAAVSLAGTLCNDSLFWLAGKAFHPLVANMVLANNLAKMSATLGNMLISYVGMRFWVFSHPRHGGEEKRVWSTQLRTVPASNSIADPAGGTTEAVHHPRSAGNKQGFRTNWSISVILPAYNEEASIAKTVYTVIKVLTTWVRDFEIIVVDDGSTDRTRMIIEELAEVYPPVRLITHGVNRGYGATLASGFNAVTKDLAFFMDSDGQFDIGDLEGFFPLIEQYDAVLGYRIERQDLLMRKINVWGWNWLVSAVFGLRVRDVDCAFKLYRAAFFRGHRLETSGAMINTEILYKFTRAGYTYTQMGVHHLPRRAGRATGAKLRVIARALRELLIYAYKWRTAKQEAAHEVSVSD